MDFPAGTLVWICGVALVASFAQGLTGFGLAVICTPLLSVMLPVQTSVPVAAVCGGAVTIPIIMTLRRHILWKPVLTLAVSAVPGIFLGARLLKGVPSAWIMGAMGAVLTCLGLFQLCNGRVPPAFRGRALGAACGFFSGMIGAAVAAPGPPVIAYTSLQTTWSVDETKAVMNVFFLLQSLVVVPVYCMNAQMTPDVLRAVARAFPFVAAGLGGGLVLSHLLRNQMPVLRRIIHAAVLLLGVYMLCRAALA
ncbi:MAG: sulfite exporter TauE/SafE family protein [Opitutaceae bacterium]|jgi:uncharacterized membrane protein YfcA|nr:sulfite exporter TauE/SafE family protein [Opitutaceae bacterium]